jgi:hypothetical protein
MERIYDWGGVTEERVGTILVVKGVYAGWGERERVVLPFKTLCTD